MRPLGILVLLSCLVLGSGCQVILPSRPVTIQVRDAETQQPIAHAHIELNRMGTHALDRGSSGDDGIARLIDDTGSKDPIGVEVTAPGYLLEQTFLPAHAVEAIPPAPRLGKDTARPVALVVDLYAEPRPSIELVVPGGYRGIVKACVHIPRDVPCPRGQRHFTFPVNGNGEADVTGPSLLERAQPADFRFRFDDGTPLTWHAQQSEIGFWWLRREGEMNFYYVGDKGEYTTIRRAEENATSEPASAPHGNGGSHHGLGGRHH